MVAMFVLSRIAVTLHSYVAGHFQNGMTCLRGNLSTG